MVFYQREEGVLLSVEQNRIFTRIFPQTTKIVGVDDCIPAVPRTRYWLDAQVYDIFDIFLYQDNKSAIFWKILERLQTESAQST